MVNRYNGRCRFKLGKVETMDSLRTFPESHKEIVMPIDKELIDEKALEKEGFRYVIKTFGAFAALFEDKTVVSWGMNSYGGDYTISQSFKGVKEIVSCNVGFAAYLEKNDDNIDVVIWGGKGRSMFDVSQLLVKIKKKENIEYKIFNVGFGFYCS
eukprot:UN32678